MSAGKIQYELSKESKKLWASRSIKQYIILMDWNSTSKNLDNQIATLKTILEKVNTFITAIFQYSIN